MTRQKPFPHSLFIGPSGIGKTRLARTLATAYGTSIVEAMGYHTRQDLAHKLGSLTRADLLLIDEAHRLGEVEQELLCEAIDENKIPDLHQDTDQKAPRDGRVSLPPWSLVLSTDQPGRLLKALHNRIMIRIELGFYSVDELKEIVEAVAAEEDLLLSPQAARIIAEVCAGLPRRARHHLQNLRLFYPGSESQQIGVTDVRTYFEASGVDESGLGQLDRQYLLELSSRGSVSLECLALLLGIDRTFVKRELEANLVKRGLVTITPAGRRLTDSGRRWVEDRQAADEETIL
jgi:Holliday junction resolvasome RuvABC ATP-dependent DNA helicase subunit